VLGLTLLLAVAGCSNMPTAPVPAQDSSASGGAAPAQVLGLLGGGGSTTNSTTKTIGLLGGTVPAGDFTVVFPPAAVLQPVTVTVTQPDLAHSTVQLSISPASANHFLLPVLLTANARKMDRSLLSVACISYYNPSTGKWENLASTVNLLGLTVSTPLFHFSTYRVSSDGKAGW
jgi:hypothetical protein